MEDWPIPSSLHRCGPKDLVREQEQFHFLFIWLSPSLSSATCQASPQSPRDCQKPFITLEH